MTDAWPSVSVVMPVRDEAATLARAVEAVLEQDYPGTLEVVIAVGPSEDDTAAVARDLDLRDERVRAIENPDGTAAAGLNAAVAASSGEVVARVDGHAVVGPRYLVRAVEVLRETGADNVGGIQEAVGGTAAERAVATAMTSRFGVGDAKFHYGGKPGPTDTVYLGVFRREAIERTGGFDETLGRNQDYELNWRIRESGGTVYFHPDLRVRYRPRGSMRALARQYFSYGRWKREVVRRHPRSLRPRQLAAPAAVLASVVSVGLALAGLEAFALVPLVHVVAAVVAAVVASRHRLREAPRVAVAFLVMHWAWGTGFLLGPRRDGSRTGARTR